MIYRTEKLSEVFRDIEGHYESSGIIIASSSNKEDIREFALRNIGLKNIRKVIDLGCGFGFFTEALKGKIGQEAVITGIDCFEDYRKPYISLCKEAGLQGRFFGSGTAALTAFEPNSADLILSSFSIYFFPEALQQVASILKKNGTFVVICHYSSHLRELTSLIEEVLLQKGYQLSDLLPHDKLISNFPAEDGKEILSGYFKKIEDRKYINELKFTNQTTGQLMNYILYKRSFFIPEEALEDSSVDSEIGAKIKKILKKRKVFNVTKNDGVFICTQPYK